MFYFVGLSYSSIKSFNMFNTSSFVYNSFSSKVIITLILSITLFFCFIIFVFLVILLLLLQVVYSIMSYHLQEVYFSTSYLL